jgi:hypothetical protein
MRLRYAFVLLAALSACEPASKPPAATAAPSVATEPQRLLRHVVLVKFKDGSTPEQIRALETAFAGLKMQLPELIRDFEFGVNNSPEALSEGLTHCFLLSFASEKDRDAYLIHPIHKAFVEQYAKKDVDKAVVVDYWNDTK